MCVVAALDHVARAVGVIHTVGYAGLHMTSCKMTYVCGSPVL